MSVFDKLGANFRQGVSLATDLFTKPAANSEQSNEINKTNQAGFWTGLFGSRNSAAGFNSLNGGLNNAARQIQLSNDDIKSNLNNQAARLNGTAAISNAPAEQTKTDEMWLFGGYKTVPTVIDVHVGMKPEEVLRAGYEAMAKRGGLSDEDGGVKEFADRRIAEDGKAMNNYATGKVFTQEELDPYLKTGKFDFWATEEDMTVLKEIKNRRELEAMGEAPPAPPQPINNAPSMSARQTNGSEQTVNSITGAIDSITGTEDQSVGAVFNRQAVSGLKVTGEFLEFLGAKETGQALQGAQSEVTRRDGIIEAHNKVNGAGEPPLVTGLQREMQKTPEFLRDVGEGIITGDFSDKETYGAKIGKMVGGLDPLGDIRDVTAGVKHVHDGKDGAWVELGANTVGAIPILGDVAKPIIKGEKQVIKEGLKDLVKTGEKEIVKEVEEQGVKDGLKQVEKQTVKETSEVSVETVKETAKTADAAKLVPTRTADVNKVMSDVDSWSLVKVSDEQKQLIKDNSRILVQRSKAEAEVVRANGFSKKQEKELIQQWERETGHTWPKGATPHHVIPLKNGGENAWWNLIPVKHPHTGTIHGTGSALREQLPYSLPDGTVTELK